MYQERFLISCRIALFIYAAFIVVVHTTGYEYTKPLEEKGIETTPTHSIHAEKRYIVDYPYLVALLYTNKTTKVHHRWSTKLHFLCAGSIISQDYVLTAASCLVGRHVNKTFVSAGVNDYDKYYKNYTTIYHIKEFYPHPEFGILLDRDIAILRMRKQIPLSDTRQPVKLPTKNRPLKEMSIVVLSGWGKIKVKKFSYWIKNHFELHTHLMVVDVPVLSHHVCWDEYNKELGIFTEVMWCSGSYQMGVDARLQGDHGAPAVQHGELVGVVSGGPGKIFRKRALYPVFTNIASPPIRNFIKTRTKM